MELHVFGESNEQEKQDIWLRLEKLQSGGVMLMTCDEQGNRRTQGDLLLIQPDGQIYLEPSISEDFGFPLDSDGRMKIKRSHGKSVQSGESCNRRQQS